MKKRTLFLKIFLWFLVVLAILMVMAITSAIFTHQGINRTEARNTLSEALETYSSGGVDILESGGREALRNYLGDLDRRTHVRIFFIPEGRVENFELKRFERLSKMTEDLLGNVMRTGKETFKYRRPFALMGRKVISSQGKTYVVLATLPVSHPFPPGEQGSQTLLRLFLVLLAGAGACYWLANHISVPVRTLRSAAIDLAGGNLSRRVDPELLKRKDELGELARSFESMAEKLEELVNSQKRLIRDISHELRSPLTRLNIALELTRKKTGPECEIHLNRIEKEVEELNFMITSLLDLSRFEADHGEMKIQQIDLSAMIGSIRDDADYEAGVKNCRVTWKNNHPVMIEGDPELLRRALENVIRNAVRYAPKGTPVEIYLTEDRISDMTSVGREISIRDHGPGVPEDELERIFQPFYRFGEARDRPSGGTGLGLAIAKRSILLHKGTIKASNHPDGGLEISIWLPLPERFRKN